jgi:hypothetical protein
MLHSNRNSTIIILVGERGERKRKIITSPRIGARDGERQVE